MKRFVAALLCAAICILTIITGCDNKPYLNIEEDDDGTVNFYGATFKLMSEWSHEFKDKKGFTATTDRQLQRYEDMEKDNNCHIEIIDTWKGPSLILMGGLAGKNVTDIIDMFASDGYDLYKAGFLYSLDEVPTIDPEDEKWGPDSFRILGRFNGVDYAFMNYYWENVPQIHGILFFNNDLKDVLGLDDPHEYTENGKWTWSVFTEQISLATCNIDEISYCGVQSAMPESLFQAAIFSNGGSVVKKLDDGRYVSGLTSRETTEALEYIAGLAQKGYIGGIFEEFTVPYLCTESEAGTLNTSQTDTAFSVTMDKFELIGFPYGPSGSPESVSAYIYDGKRMLWFPTTTFNSIEDVGTFADILFEPLPGSPEDGWRSVAGEQFFHFEQDFDQFIYSVEHCNYDYSIQTREARVNLEKAYAAILECSESVTVAIAAIETEFANAIDFELNR